MKLAFRATVLAIVSPRPARPHSRKQKPPPAIAPASLRWSTRISPPWSRTIRAAVPFAANVKFVENTVPMKPGEGLWKTASAVPATFKIYVPDPTAQQVGFIGVMQESGKPMELGLRLKLQNGRIVGSRAPAGAQPDGQQSGKSANAAAGAALDRSRRATDSSRPDAQDRSLVLRSVGDQQRRRRPVRRRLPPPRERHADHR